MEFYINIFANKEKNIIDTDGLVHYEEYDAAYEISDPKDREGDSWGKFYHFTICYEDGKITEKDLSAQAHRIWRQRKVDEMEDAEDARYLSSLELSDRI